MRKMKIILTGATGYVGEGVMLELLRTPQVEKVLSVGRRSVRIDDYPLTESEKAKLEEYMECEGRYIGKNEMPQVALMEDGVVFSFQPYQIGSYADGLFHFVVPYDEVKRYIKKN